MLAAPVTAQDQLRSGPRPINLNRDVRPVLGLLNASFGPVRDGHGRAVADRFSLSQSAPFARRLSRVSRGFIPGFVWEESGRIVGNITLLESAIVGRYLVANVAVHPDYRRRGIARALMHEALGHIESWDGREVLLQVESDNAAAIDLYHTLAFVELGVVKRWGAAVNQLRLPSPEAAGDRRPRSLQGGEWRAAYDLDQIGFKPELNWPAPPPPNYYKSGLFQKAGDLLNGRRQETWVVDDHDGRQRSLVGLVDIAGEWGRPYQLRMCIAPPWRPQLEGPLLYVAVKRLRRYRGGALWFNYPAGDAATDALLEASNFRLRRSLTVMRKYLRAV